jgi:hypothetical protein
MISYTIFLIITTLTLCYNTELKCIHWKKACQLHKRLYNNNFKGKDRATTHTQETGVDFQTYNHIQLELQLTRIQQHRAV